MKIGVVCEGPTDFVAIESFMGYALEKRGVSAQFKSLFPKHDRTRPEGGWSSLLLWLNNNPPDLRVQRYFRGGLFAGALASDVLDAVLVQIDADVLDDAGFRRFVMERYGYQVSQPDSSRLRARELETVLRLAAQFASMTEDDVRRHVCAVAVEATESWCVAAFHPQHIAVEELRGTHLTNSFMTVLERSEGRNPQPQYASIDKNTDRRTAYCNRHRTGGVRVVNSAPVFAKAVEDLACLN